MSTDAADDRGRSLEHHFRRRCERVASSTRTAEESAWTDFLTRRDVSALNAAADAGCALSPSTARFSKLGEMRTQA
jgi:hypothetical protein